MTDPASDFGTDNSRIREDGEVAAPVLVVYLDAWTLRSSVVGQT